jgi:hypothetical protein
MAIPIWKDTTASYVTMGDSQAFNISVNGKTIYNGRLVKKPGEIGLTTYVNRLVKDYLSAKIDFVRGQIIHAQDYYVRDFTISPATTAGVSAYKVYCDYGDEEGGVADSTLSVIWRPMFNVVDPRQILFCTFADLSNNTSRNVEVRLRKGKRILAESLPNKVQTFTHQLSQSMVGDIIDIIDDMGGVILASYEVRNTCAEYALYYLNAHGGYDHLLISGTTLRSDNIKRTEITRVVDNTTLKHGRNDVHTEITRTWRLNTGHLTDAQWAKTHHLLGSTHVFLHNLDSGEIVPVVIKANKADFNTYRNKGRRMSQLSIDVEESTKRERR